MEAADRTQILIDKARGGERAAFDELTARLRSRLESLIHTRLGAALRAKVGIEDVTQEALLRAFRSIGRFRNRGEDSFFRWLGGIANNVILEVARREKHDLILAVDDRAPADEISQSKAGQRHERFDRLQRSLDGLSEDHRQVILLARIERLPIKEVARRMDRSPEATSQLLWRALRNLKESFGSTDSFHLPDRQLENRGGPDARRELP